MSDPILSADLEETDLADADRMAHRLFGPDEDQWPPGAVSDYVTVVATIHRDYPQNHYKEAA